MADKIETMNDELYGGDPSVLEHAIKQSENIRKHLKDVMKDKEKECKELVKATATDAVRLQGTKETKAPNLKPFTESIDVVGRHELADLIKDARANGRAYKIERSLKEGYRYTFKTTPIEKIFEGNDSKEIAVAAEETPVETDIVAIEPEETVEVETGEVEMEEPKMTAFDVLKNHLDIHGNEDGSITICEKGRMDDDTAGCFTIQGISNDEFEILKAEFHGDEELTEASTAEKRAFRNGGEDFADYIDGKAIARIEDPEERAMLVAQKKLEKSGKMMSDRPSVADTLRRKENQAERSFEKKAQAMEDAEVEEGYLSGRKEKYTREELTELERELYELLEDNGIYPEDGTFSNAENPLGDLDLMLIISGDWKHDHLACEAYVEDFCKAHGLAIVKHNENLLEPTDSDWFKAMHNWAIVEDHDGKMGETINGFKKMFAEPEEKEEKVDEALDTKVGMDLIADEIEAIEGYDEAIEKTEDEAAKEVLNHIKSEEIEHIQEIAGALQETPEVAEEPGIELPELPEEDTVVLDGEESVEEEPAVEEEVLEEGVNIVLDDLKLFKPWGEAKDIWEMIIEQEKLPELEKALEDMYKDGITASELNDILWFEKEWVIEKTGINPMANLIKSGDDVVEVEVDDTPAEEVPSEGEDK